MFVCLYLVDPRFGRDHKLRSFRKQTITEKHTLYCDRGCEHKPFKNLCDILSNAGRDINRISSIKQAKKISWYNGGKPYDSKRLVCFISLLCVSFILNGISPTVNNCVLYEMDKHDTDFKILLIEMIVEIKYTKMSANVSSTLDMICGHMVELPTDSDFVKIGLIKGLCWIDARQIAFPLRTWQKNNKLFISGFIGSGANMVFDAVVDKYTDFISSLSLF
eukprot:591603_1